MAVSSDSPEEGRALRERLDLPFPMYSDQGCEAIRALGIYHEDEPKGRDIARPTIYVLDSERVIRYRYVGSDTYDRPTTSDLPNVVRSV